MSRLNTAYNRLLNEFKESPRIIALLSVIFARILDTDIAINDLALLRWLDTAEGVWLDDAGELLGFARPRTYILDENIFTLKVIDAPDVETQALGDVAQTTGGYLQGLDGITNGAGPIDDDEYRFLLKAKAASTNMAPTLKNQVLFCQEWFGIDVTPLPVPYTGVVILLPSAPIEQSTKFNIQHLAPVMAGVTLTVINV